jgi:hypothetical protein
VVRSSDLQLNVGELGCRVGQGRTTDSPHTSLANARTHPAPWLSLQNDEATVNRLSLHRGLAYTMGLPPSTLKILFGAEGGGCFPRGGGGAFPAPSELDGHNFLHTCTN